MKAILLFFWITYSVLPQIFPPKKITLHVTPVDAVIYETISESGELKQLGTGLAIVEVPKNMAKTIVIKRPGYADLRKLYVAQMGEKLPKEDFLTMKDRQVALKVWPTDAKVFTDGVEQEKTPLNIIIKEGEKVEVEVQKTGYVAVKKTYSNFPDAAPPPVYEELKLRDRVIQLVASPADASILADDEAVGTGHGQIVVPFDKCVVVKITKEGFVSAEKSYCNKEGIADIPASDKFLLQDRAVTIRTSPVDVALKIKGKVVGTGEYTVKIPKGECVEITAEKDGYISMLKTYCNQDNAPAIPAMDSLAIEADAAFTTTAVVDFVNINNIIDINGKSQPDAWRIMSQVVMNYFDILEITDMSTGYLRTSWVSQSFPNNTIRTRLIVKAADSNTPKYVVKLVSEESGKSGSNINDDTIFSEWKRVLVKYKDIIVEIQTRLN